MSEPKRIDKTRNAIGRGWVVCGRRWPSGQDRNPHECSQHGDHLGLHRCGCGAVSA